MKNNKNSIIVIAAVAVIAIAGIMVFAINRTGDVAMGNNMMGQLSNAQDTQADRNSADYKQYAALKGEDYDRMLLSNMTTHHEGAIEMANLALTNASHQEIKTLASAIVSAQTSEIANMTAWLKTWGYPANSSTMMMDHSSMSMQSTNAGMTNELNDKTGEAFDKAFLEQMIMHHQSAINMAATGKTNARHQEVKDLTVTIVNAQTKELLQMKQWQKNWGYLN
ncbi:DUF305 domain-containing protein [Candidatus Saccharibacteria bacterium]|nr:DUF305 domain-containing protein [Candidatus Saccharibacteria bacterium]